jgi:acetoin utilization deacetylase AcuC-like enzyme
MTTLYATHSRYTEHYHPARNHPERPERLTATWKALEQYGLVKKMQPVTPTPAPRSALEAVHTAEHLGILEKVTALNKPVLIDNDTYALPDSFQIAQLAAGAVVSTVDGVLTGQGSNGLVVVRPPGHHATQYRPMGFCLINNIAVGARHAQNAHGLQRIMIVDYDVHHGNGTQDIFYEDGSVLFVSLHQYGGRFYPGTGALNETGENKGQGATLNMPLSPGQGDATYETLFQKILWPAARRFRPEMILVSAGFDAHFNDLIANMMLSLTGYARLTQELVQMAKTLCSGRIVFVLEGGYDLEVVSHGVCNIAYALLGQDQIVDPIGQAVVKEQDPARLVSQLVQVHQL